MYMIMFVSKDVDQASEMLDVWVQAGVSGVTILESAGMQHLEEGGIREDVGIIFSLKSLMRAHEIHHRTLFSAIYDEATLNKVIEASTKHVGDWARPDVGVLFVWPLTHALGISKSFSG
jgi:nitrogen regulatory protein P-II 1